MESVIHYMRLLEEHIDKSKIKAKSEILHDMNKSVAGMIVEHARMNNAETYVIGTRGLPKFRRSLGSVAGGFSNHAHNPAPTTR
jgi:nucleotide-binding universal stress UspA family protein